MAPELKYVKERLQPVIPPSSVKISSDDRNLANKLEQLAVEADAIIRKQQQQQQQQMEKQQQQQSKAKQAKDDKMKPPAPPSSQKR